MGYLMGIDLGTSSVKTVIFDEMGTVVSTSAESYRVITSSPGSAEQNPDELWDAVVRTIKMVLQESRLPAKAIAGIGFSGQMHGLVALDCELRPLRNVIIWMDRRTVREAEQMEALPRRDTLLNAAAPGFYGASLLWLKAHEPAVYERIYKAVLPKDYIRMRISGMVGTDITDASGTGLFDIPAEVWDQEAVQALNIRSDILPEVRYPSEIAGTVSRACAALTGLAPGTPVVYGGGDQAMHSVGNGLVRPDLCSTNIGTAGQISCVVSEPLADPLRRMNTFCHAGEGLWSFVGATLNGGLALKWLREKILHAGDYDETERKAASVTTGSEGLIFLPYLCGERSPHRNPEAKGMFFGLTIGMTDAHMLRAVMEGVVYSLKDCLHVAGESGIRCDRVIASGGGARSRLWLQMQADILEKEIHTTVAAEQACLGAAIMAGVGTGIYHSLAEACDQLICEGETVYVPEEAHCRCYREGYEVYRQLYRNNVQLF